MILTLNGGSFEWEWPLLHSRSWDFWKLLGDSNMQQFGDHCWRLFTDLFTENVQCVWKESSRVQARTGKGNQILLIHLHTGNWVMPRIANVGWLAALSLAPSFLSFLCLLWIVVQSQNSELTPKLSLPLCFCPISGQENKLISNVKSNIFRNGALFYRITEMRTFSAMLRAHPPTHICSHRTCRHFRDQVSNQQDLL